ncbi:MAG TPA: SGNH/GDSL hydrolase family protein [Verrucomicrobiae bacterium]|nr:SGNH/GDSL hydrolase family protein [Verrucomicrobiae bacterium]
MHTPTAHSMFATLAAALAVAFAPVRAAGADLLPGGARLAIIGDSITEQKLYTKFMEAYLLACAGRTDVKVFQFGWSGEKADGFASRLENDLAPFQPTVATTCYGMNDGSYKPFTAEIGQTYESNMRRVAAGLQSAGVQKIVLGSPGAVDTRFFVRTNFAPLSGADGYNKNLASLRDIDKRLAAELGLGFADVHQAMLDAMATAKAALGNEYDVCGKDGFHPGPNGQLIMAYAFLRALGCDGRIADITVDMNGAATASEGHKVAGGNAGSVELVSERYPFCFDGETGSSSGTRSIAPHLPFNEKLNRFTLRVKNLEAPRAMVAWSGESKPFTREQLTAGVNLAAQFDTTPFDGQFKKVVNAIAAKQNFETLMIKNLVTTFRQFSAESKKDPELANAFTNLGKRLMAPQAELDAAVRKAIVPVKHTITVTPLP